MYRASGSHARLRESELAAEATSRNQSPGNGRRFLGATSGPIVQSDLGLLYEHALEVGLRDPSEGALRRGYEIGRQAMSQGFGVLEMATMHHEALARVLPRLSRSSWKKAELRRAGQFLAESLSAYEMSHRGFRQAITALRQLNETMEREIQRIARTVHDEAGQLFEAARLAMSGVAHDKSARLQEIGAILDQAETALRRLSHELRPTVLDDFGLVPALRLLAHGVSKRTDLAVKVKTSLDERLPPPVETALYRIVQEALTNATRHSRARNVRIQLARDVKRNLRCVIQDDGIGFDVGAVLSRSEEGGLGLVGIRERLNALGGTLHIHSEPRRGSALLIEIPAEK